MARLTWLADVLRAEGLVVSEAAGWKTRGASGWSLDAMNPAGVIAHATVTRRTSGPAPGLNIIINGREGLAGPIAQLHLARDGRYTVVAAGVANHAGSGGLWGVSGNQRVIGIEAENDNGMEGPSGTGKYPTAEPWPAVQYDAYVRGTAAILRHLGLPASRVGAHREWSTTGKSDPVGIDMNQFRARVAAAIEGDDVSAEDVWAHVIPSPSLGNRTASEWLKGGEKAASAANTAATLAVTANTKVDAVIAQLGIVLTEVDSLEESAVHTIALVQAIQVGDWDALAERLEASQRQGLIDALQRVHITLSE